MDMAKQHIPPGIDMLAISKLVVSMGEEDMITRMARVTRENVNPKGYFLLFTDNGHFATLLVLIFESFNALCNDPLPEPPRCFIASLSR